MDGVFEGILDHWLWCSRDQGDVSRDWISRLICIDGVLKIEHLSLRC